MIGDVSKLILVSQFMFLNSNKFKLRSFLLTHYLWIWSKARSSGDNPLLIHQSIFLYYIYYGISLLSVKIFHRDELFESYSLRNSSNLNVATVPYIVQFIKSRILFEVWSNHLNVSNLSEAEVGHKFKCNHPYKSQNPHKYTWCVFMQNLHKLNIK